MGKYIAKVIIPAIVSVLMYWASYYCAVQVGVTDVQTQAAVCLFWMLSMSAAGTISVAMVILAGMNHNEIR